MKLIKGIMAMLVAGLLISSCGDSEEIDVKVNLQMNVGDEALVHDVTYNINGTDVQFTNVAFYLGDMKFETSDGKTFESSSRYNLIKPGVYNFNFSVAADEVAEDYSLSRVTFFVGVDADTNAETEMDFTEREVDDPLGQQNPSMHWGWAGGYKFLNIDGFADIDGDGEFETKLTYHLGKDSFLKNISLSTNKKIDEGENDFQITFDMSSFLANLDFATENFTKVQPDNMATADKLLNNYNTAFSFVE